MTSHTAVGFWHPRCMVLSFAEKLGQPVIPTCHVPWRMLFSFPGQRRPTSCQTIRWDWKWCPWFPGFPRTSLTNVYCKTPSWLLSLKWMKPMGLMCMDLTSSIVELIHAQNKAQICVAYIDVNKLTVWFHDFLQISSSLLCSSGDPCAGKAASIRGQFTGAQLTWLRSGIDQDEGKLQLHSRFHQYRAYIHILHIYLLSLFRMDRSR